MWREARRNLKRDHKLYAGCNSSRSGITGKKPAWLTPRKNLAVLLHDCSRTRVRPQDSHQISKKEFKTPEKLLQNCSRSGFASPRVAVAPDIAPSPAEELLPTRAQQAPQAPRGMIGARSVEKGCRHVWITHGVAQGLCTSYTWRLHYFD